MNDELNYYVDLRADFKRPESIEEPTGGELAGILAAGLPAYGITVNKNKGVDSCHYVACVAGSSIIELMVSTQIFDETEERWDILPNASDTVPVSDYRTLLMAVDSVLRNCDRISDIRWFPQFETPEYLALMPSSPGPIRDANLKDCVHPLIHCYWSLNRVNNAITHPIAVISYFLFVCVLFALTPDVAAPIASVTFFTALALMTVVPFMLSLFVDREAKRISASGG